MSRRSDALKKGCPECGAMPDQPCQNDRGPRRSVHRGRFTGLTPYVKRRAALPTDILERTVQLALESYREALQNYIDYPLRPLESPIEHAMFVAFAHEAYCGFRLDMGYGDDWEGCPRRDYQLNPGGPKGYVYAQCQVGKYRADFMVSIVHNFGHHQLTRFIAIECDGHEFHHASKQQVERDKARDRYFASQNILVMRFAGSEIYRSALACVEQVAETADRIFNDWHSQIADIEFAQWKESQGE